MRPWQSRARSANDRVVPYFDLHLGFQQNTDQDNAPLYLVLGGLYVSAPHPQGSERTLNAGISLHFTHVLPYCVGDTGQKTVERAIKRIRAYAPA